MQSVKNGFAPPFSLCFSKSRAARQSPFCKAVARPFQSRRKALPKSTKTGRKSVGFLILTQAPKCTRSHCFPPQKHPKNGFMMRFAGKNSFFQLRARDFSFYMNAYSSSPAIAQPMASGPATASAIDAYSTTEPHCSDCMFGIKKYKSTNAAAAAGTSQHLRRRT